MYLYHIVTFVRLFVIILSLLISFGGHQGFFQGETVGSAWRAKASVQPSVVCYNAVLSALSRGARLDVGKHPPIVPSGNLT